MSDDDIPPEQRNLREVVACFCGGPRNGRPLRFPVSRVPQGLTVPPGVRYHLVGHSADGSATCLAYYEPDEWLSLTTGETEMLRQAARDDEDEMVRQAAKWLAEL